MKNKMIITLLIACMLVQQTRAQGNGLAGIQEATQMITSYFDPATHQTYLCHWCSCRTDWRCKGV